MPDSQVPPLWGPAYDDRDLDALLSGAAGSIPVALQPVDATLAALRAAATRRELSDEAKARAAFRAFLPAPAPPVAATVPQPVLPPLPLPPTMVAPTTFPRVRATVPQPVAAEHPGVSAHTLILPAPGERTQPATRSRHRRLAGRSRARRSNLALTGAAAAALVVVAVAAIGAVTGSFGPLTSFGRPPAHTSAADRASGQSKSSAGVLGSGVPTRTPAPQHASAAASTSNSPHPTPTSDPATLCHEYFEDWRHPAPGGKAAEIALGQRLGKLARGGWFKIIGYCFHQMNPSDDKTLLPPVGHYGGHEPLWPGSDPGAGNPGGGVQPTPSATSNSGPGGRPSPGPGPGVGGAGNSAGGTGGSNNGVGGSAG